MDMVCVFWEARIWLLKFLVEYVRLAEYSYELQEKNLSLTQFFRR